MKKLVINPDDMNVVMRVFDSILNQIQLSEGKRYCSITLDVSKGMDGKMEIEWAMYSPRTQEITKGKTVEEVYDKMRHGSTIEGIDSRIEAYQQRLEELQRDRAKALAAMAAEDHQTAVEPASV